jgi:hypothetical protein
MPHQTTVVELPVEPQVHTLFELMAGKSVDTPQQEINRQIKRRRSTLNHSVITKGLMLFGIISLAMGILTLASAVSLFSSVSLSSLVKPMLLDGTSDLILGALTIASSRVMAKGRLLGIWLYVASVLMSYLYTVAVGEKLNVILLGFSLLFIWHIFQSRQDLGLS